MARDDGRQADILKVQKAIAKYGLAAHLAILAVAPLFLFPFLDDGAIAVVLLWLSLPAVVWTFMQPSVRRGEMLHDARERVSREVFRDPIFWMMLIVVAFSGVRALNTGVAMAYDAETASWHMAAPALPLMPASVGDAGFLPFSASLACMVLVVGCRHALGRSARQAYFLVSSALAGAAAAMAAVLANLGNAAAADAASCPYRTLSYVGVAFALHFVSGIVAVAAVIENRWNRAFPVLVASVGFTAAGAYLFSPAYSSAAFLAAALAVFAYAFFYAIRTLRRASEFKMVLAIAIALLCGWVLAVMTAPGQLLASRLSAALSRAFFPDWYDEARKVLSAVSVKAWMSSPWTGTGIGSFMLDVRFNAAPTDWASIPRGLVAPPLGWLKLLTERGIAGAAMMALPVLFLLVVYLRRLAGWLFVRTFPQPGCWAAPAVLMSVTATGFFDCSYLRADVLMAVAGMLSLSASSFPKAGNGGKNG